MSDPMSAPVSPSVADMCIARESEGGEFAGRIHGPVTFTKQFRDKTDGRRFDIQGTHGQRWSGVARFRGNELWLTEIEPVMDAPEVSFILLVEMADGGREISRQNRRATGKRAQRARSKPWCR